MRNSHQIECSGFWNSCIRAIHAGIAIKHPVINGQWFPKTIFPWNLVLLGYIPFHHIGKKLNILPLLIQKWVQQIPKPISATFRDPQLLENITQFHFRIVLRGYKPAIGVYTILLPAHIYPVDFKHQHKYLENKERSSHTLRLRARLIMSLATLMNTAPSAMSCACSKCNSCW